MYGNAAKGVTGIKRNKDDEWWYLLERYCSSVCNLDGRNYGCDRRFW
jgi:hypothetical protein